MCALHSQSNCETNLDSSMTMAYTVQQSCTSVAMQTLHLLLLCFFLTYHVILAAWSSIAIAKATTNAPCRKGRREQTEGRIF